MAKNDISLNINTKFNGDGLKKLDAAMQTAGTQARSASKALGGIQSALGGIGGEAGKVAGQIGNVASAFTQMGIAGGVIAAGTLAIEGLFKWLGKTNDALSNLAKGFSDKLKGALSKVNAEIAKTNKLFADLISGRKVNAERENILDDFGISKMEEQKKQALAGKEGSEAAKIELEWTKKIEDAKEKQSKKHLDDVREEIRLTELNLKKQQEAQKKAEAKFKDLNTFALNSWNDDNLDIVTKNRRADDANIAKKEAMAYKKPIEELQKKLVDLRTKELKASKDAELAPMRKQSAIMEGEAKIRSELKKEAEGKAKKAEEDKRKKEAADKKKKEEEDKNIREEMKSVNKERAQILKDANKEQKELTEQEKKLKDDLSAVDGNMKTLAQRAKETSDQWKQNAKGDHFNSWDRKRRREQEAADKAARTENSNRRGAEAFQENIAKRIFDRNGNLRKSAGLFDIGKFANITDFLGGNGISAEQRQSLQEQADKLGAKLFDKNGNLKKGMERTREYDTYRNIKGLLGKMDDVDNAKAKQDELRKIEEQKRKNEEQRTKSLENIDKKLADLEGKLGM